MSRPNGWTRAADGPPVGLLSEPFERTAFVCADNAARSQMAEGFARAMAPPDTRVWSAGLDPARLDPIAVEVMREVGIDISAHASKPIAAIPWPEVDSVIVLGGGGEELTVPADVRRFHWPLPDPAQTPYAHRLEAYREAREEIRWRVSSLWTRSD